MGYVESVAVGHGVLAGAAGHHRPVAPDGVGVDPQKLLPPLDRPGLVRRPRLLHALAAVGDDVPLLLVVAPAGYGKTTLLGQWVLTGPRPFGWVHLDPSDNDPIRLLRHVALALHQIRPVGDPVWRALSSPTAVPLGAALPRLLSATTAGGACWTLVLDDLDVLAPSLGADVLLAFADGLPPGCRLAVSSRNRPATGLSRLRTQGRCAEIGPGALAFTADEAGAVFAGTGVRISGRAVQGLLRRTEGWPAGVYLAALALRGSPDPDAAAGDIAGSDTVIVDYFREEVLTRESAGTVRFLLRTAPLEQMSGPLCDAVLGRTGSAVRLADIERRNLFVVPVGRGRDWYRYHRLFGEMLVSELRHREPDEEIRVHRRASAWYAEQGLVEPAVAHALAGDDTMRAAGLVARYGQPFFNAGRVHTVRRWLRSLAEGALDSHPPLAVVAGWIWALTGDASRAQRCLLAAERGVDADAGHRWLDEGPPPAGAAGAAATARLRAALAPLGVERMLVDARRAHELEQPGGDWYPMASLLLGMAELLNGAADPAVNALERAAHYGRADQRSSASFALAQLSLLAAGRGEASAAQTYAAESWELVRSARMEDHLPSIATYTARATVALHRRDARAARHEVGRALRLYTDPSPVAFPWLAVQMSIALGRLLLDLGDHPAARLKEMEARRYLARLLTEGALRGSYERFAADLAHRGWGMRSPSAMTLTAAELRVLQLLPTHLRLSEIAEQLFISRNTVKSQVAAVYGKLRASSRAEAVREARKLGLLD